MGTGRGDEPGGHSGGRPVCKLDGAGSPDSRSKARHRQAGPLGLGLLVCKMGPSAAPWLRKVPGVGCEEAGRSRWISTSSSLRPSRELAAFPPAPARCSLNAAGPTGQTSGTHHLELEDELFSGSPPVLPL